MKIEDIDMVEKDRKPDILMAPVKHFLNITLIGTDMQFAQPMPVDCLDVSMTSTFDSSWFEPEDPHEALRRKQNYLG